MNILNNNLKWYLFVKEVFYVFWKFIKKRVFCIGEVFLNIGECGILYISVCFFLE